MSLQKWNTLTSQDYLDIAGVIILILDTDGTVSLINQKGCEILGYKEAEIVGKNWFDNFLPNNLIEKTKNTFSQLTDGEVSTFEYYENPVKSKNGIKHILWHNKVLRDSDGNITGTISSGEDITIQKQLKEKIERQARMFHDTFKLSPIATFILNSKGFVIDANEKTEKMLQAEKSVLIGMHFLNFTHPDDRESSIECFRLSRVFGKPRKITKKYVTIYGEEILSDTTVNYIDKNGDSYFIVQAADITHKQIMKEKVIETLNGIREITNRTFDTF